MKRHVALISMIGLGGCGPVVSGVQIINAKQALEAAEAAGAQRTAIYEYTTAVEYLHKAREENSYSDFRIADQYATKALESAVRARKIAQAAGGVEQSATVPSR